MAQSSRKPKITLKTGSSGKPRVVLKAGNGKTLMHSENYASNSNVKRAAVTIKKAAAKATVTNKLSKAKKK